MTGPDQRFHIGAADETFAMMNLLVAYSVSIRGPLDTQRLAHAFHLLCKQYPILATRPCDTGHGEVNLAAAEGPPRVMVSKGSLGRQALFELDHRSELAALLVRGFGRRAVVTLAVHHCVADPGAAVAMLSELWRLYTALAERLPLRLDPPIHPEPLERICTGDQAGEPLPSSVPPSIDTACRHRLLALPSRESRMQLDAQTTAELRQVCRDNGFTLHSLVAAATLTIESIWRSIPVTALPYLHPVQLREHMAPGRAAAGATNVLGYATFHVYSDDGDVLTLAREIDRRVACGLRTGDVLRSGLEFGAVVSRLLDRDPVVVTNWGRIPDYPLPHTLQLEDFRGTYDPDPAARPGSGLWATMYLVSTFQGRLSVEVGPHRASSAARDRRAATVRAERLELLLRSIAGGRRPNRHHPPPRGLDAGCPPPKWTRPTIKTEQDALEHSGRP